MADTTFTNAVTLTDEDWFNDVNRLHYTIFGDPTNLASAHQAFFSAGVAQNIAVGGTLSVSAQAVTNALRVNSTLSVSAATTLASVTTGNLTAAGTLSVSAAATFSGRILGPDGAAATPTYSFSGATNLGCYRDSAGAGLIVAASGTAVLRLSNAADFFVLANNAALVFSRTGITSGDTFLISDAANTLAQRNGANAQVFRVYNTFTDASNYERAVAQWSGNVFAISTENAGTGSARNMQINVAGGTLSVSATTALQVVQVAGTLSVSAAAVMAGVTTGNLTVGGTLSVSAAATMRALAATDLSASSVAGLVVATQAQQEAGTSTATIVTPGRQQYHPASAKAWARFDGTATSVTAGAAFNITSITRNSVGDYTLVYTTPFSGNLYAAVAMATLNARVNSASAANATVTVVSPDGTAVDSNVISFIAFGDQ